MKRSVLHFILIMLILGCSAVTAHTISPDTSDPVQEAYKLTFTGKELDKAVDVAKVARKWLIFAKVYLEF